MEMKVYLYKPKKSELGYRKQLLQEKDTMQYNAGYNMKINGYNYETGVINKTDEELNFWYESWNASDKKKYYAYICDKESNQFVGEIYFYYQEHNYGMGIVIINKYRGKGYGYQALIELQKIAFEEYNVNALVDTIPENRLGAIKTFKKAGFIENGIDESIRFKKRINSIKLIITREMYHEMGRAMEETIEEILKRKKYRYSSSKYKFV